MSATTPAPAKPRRGAERNYFRAMTPMEDGLPHVGAGKRMLGVLPAETNAADGTFGPGTGGMSVSPDSPWNVPHHRRPRDMGRGATGPRQDWIFGIADPALGTASLFARLDPRDPLRHAFVEPRGVLTLDAYGQALATTRSDWRRAWP